MARFVRFLGVVFGGVVASVIAAPIIARLFGNEVIVQPTVYVPSQGSYDLVTGIGGFALGSIVVVGIGFVVYAIAKLLDGMFF